MYYIAEVASAHQGSIDILKSLLFSTINSDFSYIKIQVYFTEELLSPSVIPNSKLKQNQLSKDDWLLFFKWYDNVMTTYRDLAPRLIIECFGVGSFNFCSSYSSCKTFKLSTADFCNTFLLEKLINYCDEIFLGTGGSTLEEIQFISKYCETNRAKISLIHGFQSYPTNLEDSDLWKIRYLQQLTNMPVGFADHADASDPITRFIVSGAAVLSGASFIEKHITLDRSAKGSDYFSSIQPDEFTEYFNNITYFSQLSSKPSDQPIKGWLRKNEFIYRNNMKKYACAGFNIDPGHILSNDDILFLRCNEGEYLYTDISKLIGMEVACFIPSHHPLQSSHFLY